MQRDPSARSPFSGTATGEFVSLLSGLGCSLVISTYQAGKLILISASDEGLVQLPRDFDKPMGLAIRGPRLAIATRNEVVVLADAPMLAQGYPKRPGVYDSLYVPRAVYFTGEVDIHDLAWRGDGLIAVNTRFSCVCQVDGHLSSFVPLWKPPFITDLTPEDRCHLNGMALTPDGAVRFVTAYSKADTAHGWRESKEHSGVLLEVPDGRVVLEGLCMPHSPRLIDGKLYVLNSGTGQLMAVDPGRRSAEAVIRLPGFLRGLTAWGDILFVGLSRLRDTRAIGALPLEQASDELTCGVAAVERQSGRLLGMFSYADSCEEISDIGVVPHRRPGILGVLDDTHRAALALPDQGFWSTPAEPDSDAQPTHPAK